MKLRWVWGGSVFVHIYGLLAWFNAGAAQVQGALLGNNHTSFGTLKEVIMGSQFEIIGKYERSLIKKKYGTSMWRRVP